MKENEQKIYAARSYIGWMLFGAAVIAFQGLQFPGLLLVTVGIILLIIISALLLLVIPKAYYNQQEIRIPDFPHATHIISLPKVVCLSRSNANWIEIRWEHDEVCWNQRLNGSPKDLDKFTDFVKKEKPSVVIFETLKNEVSQEAKQMRTTAWTYAAFILFSAFMIGSIFLAIYLAKTL